MGDTLGISCGQEKLIFYLGGKKWTVKTLAANTVNRAGSCVL